MRIAHVETFAAQRVVAGLEGLAEDQFLDQGREQLFVEFGARRGEDPVVFRELERDAAQLSVGQKQRVALGRALIGEPDVLLLDEPTSGLDPRLAERLLDRLASVRRKRELTMVMVTHRFEEARRMGGEMAVMIEGRIETRGSVESVIGQTGNERVRQFLLGDGDASG